MSSKKQAPAVSLEVVEWLEKTFPDRCPSPETPDREIWMAAGKAAVARYLRTLLEKQKAEALSSGASPLGG